MAKNSAVRAALPEFNGDLHEWNHDTSALQMTLEAGSYEFEACLPPVVGWMPANERVVFQNLEIERYKTPRYKPGIFFMLDDTPYRNYLEEAIPETLKVIRDDIALLSDDSRELESVWVQIQEPKETKGPERPDQRLHADIAVGTVEQSTEPFYLAADIDTPSFYKGPARLVRSADRVNLNLIELDAASLDSEGVLSLTPAPPFAIVRLSYATIHRGPSDLTRRRVILKALSTRI